MNTKNAKTNKPQPIKLDSFKVIRAKAVELSSGKTFIPFDVKLNEISINGCSVGTDKDGNDFISYPSYKGNDGKYYQHASAYLSKEDQAAILADVERIINE